MKQFIFGGALMCLFLANARGQRRTIESEYEMKPAAIQTRWAKQVNPKNVLPEYPRPQMVRSNWTNLNGLWEYAITAANAEHAPTNFDGDILVPYPVESALSGVKKTLDPDPSYNQQPSVRKSLWYRRKFRSPVLKSGERLLLNFGAVSWEAIVYVNGQEAGNHTGSYTAFSFDITEFVEQGDNEIAVQVCNPLEDGIGPRGKQTKMPAQIWYTPSSGIWQTVWLEKVPASYIKEIKITPDVDKSEVRIWVNAASDATVSITAAGQTIKGKADKEIIIPVNNPRLWSPNDPYLYDVSITLGSDEVKSYFGMRKVEIKKDAKGYDRIFLNDNYTYNLGTLDQGFWPDGLYTAPTDEALKFDIQASKTMGFNTIRKHIKVEPARWYYHADKLGMLVWQDMVPPGTQFGTPPTAEAKTQFEKESAEILMQLHNYPSITTWVLFNESWGEYDQARLTKWIKDTDPTRLVNGHSGAAIVEGVIQPNVAPVIEKIVTEKSINSDMVDIHSYPPPAILNRIDGKAMVLGEFGGIGVQVEGHLWDDITAGWGYGNTVSVGTMHKQYAVMTDSLIAFEKRGLSASIYTQPFDVESEQNGLITYDREILKIPAENIRAIHRKLWPTTSNYALSTKGFTAKLADTSVAKDYVSRYKEYQAGKKDSASLRALALMAYRAKQYDTASAIGNDYIKQLKNPVTETNIKLILMVTQKSTDLGYAILSNNLDKIKLFMSVRNPARTVQRIIYKEQVKQLLTENPNWNAVDAIIKNYPQIDGEFVIGNCVVFYRSALQRKEKNALQNMIISATMYDDRYNGGAYNSWAWEVFENSSDKTALTKALEWTEKSLAESLDANNIDTHANVLYKLGRKEEAIKWEEKALALRPDNELYQKVLNKMKAGTATWPTP